MNKAFEEAKLSGESRIKPEHLVFAILQDNKNSALDVLLEVEADIDQICADIESNFRTKTVNRGRGPFGVLPLSDMTKAIMTHAEKECDLLNIDYLDVSHILLSTLKFDTIPTEVFLKHGITYETFFDTLKNMKVNMNSGNFDPDDEQSESFKKKKDNKNSKTPVLDNFCRDITKAAEEGKIDPIVGRAKEIKRVAQILSRRKKNNPVLIGDPGVGKTAVIEGLALLIKTGKAPRILHNKRILSLDLAGVVAGTKYRGQFEERIKAILEELTNNRNVIVFMDELHTLIGAGGASGSLDAANIFKPALARGEIQVIGATTLDEFREHIEKDGALTRRFQQVLVDPPTLEETLTILRNIKSTYEDYHKVKYTDEAIEECVKLSDRYITDRQMPDKAIDVLDEAGSSSQVNVEPPQEIKDLEEKIESIKIEKLRVVKTQKYEEAAKLRDQEQKTVEQLEKAKEIWATELDKKRTVVDVNTIAEVVSMITGIPVSKISAKENKRLLNMEKDLNGKVIGQDPAVEKIAKALKRNRVGIKDPKKPIGSFIFLGPTGVGKTYLAKLLAEYVFGNEDALIRIDMSEYMEKFTITRLVGSPPGYVGHEEGGQLTEKVRRRPYSVVLFDEIEKAHPDVFNIMLQLLDEGHITDGLGRKINFKNTLIIMTSNVGVKDLEQFGKGVGFSTKAHVAMESEKSKMLIEKALKKTFRPEFLNRLDDIIIFQSLNEEDIAKIIKMEVKKLEGRIGEIGYKLKLTKSAIDYLAEVGYDKAYGARPLNRAIQKYVEDPICEEILAGNVKEGDTLTIKYDKTKGIIVKANSTDDEEKE